MDIFTVIVMTIVGYLPFYTENKIFFDETDSASTDFSIFYQNSAHIFGILAT